MLSASLCFLWCDFNNSFLKLILYDTVVSLLQICDRKLGWDVELPKDLKSRWARWLDSLPSVLTFPRSIPRERASITEIHIHGFADASILGCCGVIYVVAKQGELVSRGLLVSKARLAKRNLTIPRLELVSCHMVCNLIHNTKKVHSYLPVTGCLCVD